MALRFGITSRCWGRWLVAAELLCFHRRFSVPSRRVERPPVAISAVFSCCSRRRRCARVSAIVGHQPSAACQCHRSAHTVSNTRVSPFSSTLLCLSAPPLDGDVHIDEIASAASRYVARSYSLASPRQELVNWRTGPNGQRPGRRQRILHGNEEVFNWRHPKCWRHALRPSGARFILKTSLNTNKFMMSRKMTQNPTHTQQEGSGAQ